MKAQTLPACLSLNPAKDMEKQEVRSKTPEEILGQIREKLNPISEQLRILALNLEEDLNEVEQTWTMHHPDETKTAELLTTLGSLRGKMEDQAKVLREFESKIAEYREH